MFQEGESGISLETLYWKWASSHIEGGESRGFSRGCGRTLEVPRVAMGNTGNAHLASEKSGFFSVARHIRIPLGSLPANRAMSRVQSAVQETQCSSPTGDRDLGLPFKVQLGNQASFAVETWNTAFHLSCQTGLRPLSRSGRVFGLIQEDPAGRQTSKYVEGYSVFPWSQGRAIRTYLELGGN